MTEYACVPDEEIVAVAGEIKSAEFIVTFEFATAPKLSVTRTTADPLLAGAVYKPVVALILPLPLKTEKVYGLVPPTPEKVAVLFTAKVFGEGEILRAEVIVTAAVAVFPNESETSTVAVPLAAGAV